MSELEQHEKRVAFEKKYVLRIEHERDMRVLRRDTIINTSVLILLVIPSIVGLLYFLLQLVGII